MKKWVVNFIIICIVLFAQKVNGQVFTQSFVDKCTGEIKIATTTYVRGNAVVSFYNQVRTFTPLEVQSGILNAWLQTTYLAYSTLGCPTNVVVQQTVQQAVTQAAAQAAAAAASAAAQAAADAAAKAASDAAAKAAADAAAKAASSSASGAASSSASSAASSSATAATSSVATPPPTSTPPPASSSSTPPPASSSSSSSSGGSSSSSSSSSGSSTESKTETKTEAKTESKTEEKKTETKSEETKSESKEEKKEESKSEEKKEEKTEEKKEEKKEKKKTAVTNPMMLSSDLAGTESADGEYAVMMSVGVSKSSLMGDKSYSSSALIWSTFDQFALSSGVTKMVITDGKLKALNSYSLTSAYLKGTLMGLVGYTWIKPHPTLGTFGYNLGAIMLMMKGTEMKYNTSFSTSVVVFWTKPYQYSKKLTVSPQVFVMSAPIAYNAVTGGTSVSRTPGALLGTAIDYRISKRFGFNFGYKANIAFEPEFSLLHNFQIGSKMTF